MKVMILAAGLGTRLLPHTNRLPKPLFPILDKTLLQLAIETALLAKPELIVINTFHLAEMIDEYVNSNDFGVEIVLSHEPEIMGTAGGIGVARKWLADGDFGVINSDVVVDVPWKQLIEFHKYSNAASTLMLRKSPDGRDYGLLGINDLGRVTKFLNSESPYHRAGSRPFMFTGVSILSPKIFELIPHDRPSDISGEVYGPMVTESGPLFGFEYNGTWVDSGTVEDYHSLVMGELEGGVCWMSSHDKPTDVIEPVYIHPTATFEEGCHVGPNVAIHEGAVIKNGSVVRNSVVLPGSEVVEGETLDGAIR